MYVVVYSALHENNVSIDQDQNSRSVVTYPNKGWGPGFPDFIRLWCIDVFVGRSTVETGKALNYIKCR